MIYIVVVWYIVDQLVFKQPALLAFAYMCIRVYVYKLKIVRIKKIAKHRRNYISCLTVNYFAKQKWGHWHKHMIAVLFYYSGNSFVTKYSIVLLQLSDLSSAKEPRWLVPLTNQFSTTSHGSQINDARDNQVIISLLPGHFVNLNE